MEPPMQEPINPTSYNNIDLYELFMCLWAYKFLIAFIFMASFILAGFYALNEKKEYKSEAIFKLDDNQMNNMSIANQLGMLSRLSQVRSNFGTSTISSDKISGRVFIEKLDSKLNFKEDPFFNTYNPDYVDPYWKATIKNIIGWKQTLSNPNEAIWQSIVTQFSKKVQIKETEKGTIKIVVLHKNANRAALIANTIMHTVITNLIENKNRVQDEQLDFLAKTLAKALQDLESASTELKNFALKNNALPLEDFAAGSLKLDALREQYNRTSKLRDAVSGLIKILTNNTASEESYLRLRQEFPIIDQVEFRRVLGQNEIMSSWSWPKKDTAITIFNTLSERKNRLEAQISNTQKDAERSGAALEEYGKLERRAKVAEATYTVLIEQVKAQSMAAGYRPNESEIYEYAAPSINPSSSKKNLTLAFGSILGILVGCGLSLFLGLRRGVYFSEKSLLKSAQSKYNANSKSLNKFKKYTPEDIENLLLKNPNTMLRNIAVEINKSRTSQVVITSSGAKLLSGEIARIIAAYMQSESIEVAILNFSNKKEKKSNSQYGTVGSFMINQVYKQTSTLVPSNNCNALELLTKRDFIKDIKHLNTRFNLIFFCADNDDAISLLRSLEGQDTFHIMSARAKHTKADNMFHMRSLLPIQGLIHE